MGIGQFLFKWFDKAILAAALAFLVWTASRINPPPEVKVLSEQVQDLAGKVQHRLDTDRPPPLPDLDHYARLKEDFANAPDVPPRPKPAWHPPQTKVHVLQVMKSQKIDMMLDHPVRGRIMIHHGGEKRPVRPNEVTVSENGTRLVIDTTHITSGSEFVFHDSRKQRHLVVMILAPFVPDPWVRPPANIRVALMPGTKNPKVQWDGPAETDKRAPLQAYIVYRKKGDEDEFRKLQVIRVQAARGQLAPGASYEDTNTAFDTVYFYTVSSYSDAAEPSESAKGELAKIAIDRDFEFFLKSAADDFARIKVYKWHKKRWLHRTFTVKPGDEIGAIVEKRFKIDGRWQKLKVDFRTGCRLVDIDLRCPYRKVVAGQPVEFLDQRIDYHDKGDSLKSKWRREPDVAPWERFAQAPPSAPGTPRPGGMPAPGGGRGPREPDIIQ